MTRLASAEISEASRRLDEQHLAQAQFLARRFFAAESSNQSL
jgi:hypothetical protein